ncbi:MAG TPA: hypothetical protein VF013_06685 [Candidatus Limnocylindria bacterium]
MRRVLPLALGLLVAGCSLLGGSGNGFDVSLERSDATITVRVVDEVGLVREATGGAPEPPAGVAGSEPMAYSPNGDLTRLSVRWISNPCSQHPTLTISGNALSVVIDLGPMPGACDDVGIVNAVTLSLNRVIDASDVDVSVRP